VSAQDLAWNLLERWRAGDQAAAEELHRRYAQRLCALAEREIGRRLSRRVGADDVVQSVFRTFFRRTAAGEFVIDHSGNLWQLLARITLNKVRRQGEHYRAGKRNVASEDSAADLPACSYPFAHDPGPDEAAMLADEIETVLKELETNEAMDDEPTTTCVPLFLKAKSALDIRDWMIDAAGSRDDDAHSP
jgi:hypothetical protein